MGDLLTFLAQLKAKEISVSLDDSFENLRIRGDLKNLSPLDKQELVKNKAELITFLKDQISVSQTIESVKSQLSYPISDAQRRLWVLSQIEDSSVAYNMPFNVTLKDDIEIEKFKRAIGSTIERHESLRTVFKEDKTGEVRQWILKKAELGFKIDYRDFRKEENKQHKVQSYIREDSYKPFDLAKGPLLRAGLLQVEDDEYVFYYNMHHIISDGWSMNVLAKDVISFYQAYKENKKPALKELRIQYKDYSAWQLAQLKEEFFNTHRAFWLNKLSGELSLLDLPGARQRPNVKTHHGSTVVAFLNADLTGKLRNYALQMKGTLFMGITAALKALLYRYTGQEDIILGTPIAGRNHSDLENQIGFYVNALVLRSRISGRDSFDKVYEKVRHTILEAYDHQMYPFDRLVEDLEQSRLTSRSAVFDMMIGLENIGEKTGGLSLVEERIDDITEYEDRTCKYDIEFGFQEEGDYLRLAVDYNKDIYEGEIIKGFIRHFKEFISLAMSDPATRIGAIDFLSKEENPDRFPVLQIRKVDYPVDKTIVDLFHEQAMAQRQDLPAFFRNTGCTYEELEKRSNQVAQFLHREIKLEKEEVVGLLLDPGPDTMGSMLGVLKAGGAYLLIDGDLPEERISSLISDLSIRTLITGKEYIELSNRLQWGASCLEHYLCVDSEDVKSYPDHHKHVLMVQELWDHVGEKAENQITGGGWQSSYTGQAISAHEMEEYSMNVYKKLKDSLDPGMRVLEIGCSSGLTLRKVAPEVGLYYGTDLSSVIISRTKKMVADKGLKNVKLQQLAAHELSRIEEKEFDLVIINSVIQDFPSHNYLRRVIKDSMTLLKEEGRIFIGDVMDMNKKKDLIKDLEAFKKENKNKGYTTKTNFSTDLFVARGYFMDLLVDEKDITDVAISEKIRTVENELTKFRYDVIVQVDKKQSKNKAIKNGQQNRTKRHKWQHDRNILEAQPDTDPKIKITPGQLACIVHPSYTAARPERAMVEHGDVVRLFNTDTPLLDFNASDTWTKLHSYVFDFSVWQLAQLKKELFINQRNFWLNKLSGELPLLNLPAAKPHLKLKTNHGRCLSTYIDRALAGKLQKFSHANEGSLFMGLLAAWNVLMYRYTSQKDIITGTLIRSGEHAGLTHQTGFYINTLALRAEILPEESFKNFFQRLRDDTLDSYRHQMYPFDRLMEELSVQKNAGRNAVDVMFIFQEKDKKNREVDPVTAGLKADLSQIVDLGPATSKFAINIAIQETGDHLSFTLVYNEEVYEQKTMESIMRHYKQLLAELVENPEEKISQIDYLSGKEKHELLVTFNETKIDYPKDKTIVDLFAEQVKRNPDNIAAVFNEKELTYRELNEWSDQLAGYLEKNYAIRPNDLVGIKLEKSEWLIVSVLGVLKSGGAYVPIDPNYPQDRVDYIEKDIRCKICIDENELKAFRDNRESYSKQQATVNTQPTDLAYVIYTSGSTGRPKGVMVNHRNLINKLFEERSVLAIENKIVTYCLTNYVFDVSLLEIFLPLLSGGKIVMPAQESVTDITSTVKQIVDHNVSLLQGTPTYFTHFIAELTPESTKKLNGILRTICIGGESLDAKLVSEMKRRLPDVILNNHYGPTEITIDAIVRQDIKSFGSNIIGKPLGNTKAYILDEHQKLVPLNVTGEIVISGPSVSQGYLHQAELSQEKFIDSPFEEGEKMYRTGDFGKWSEAGEIEFLGRKDDQIKVRGYRIELGEIETILKNHPQIENALVLLRNIHTNSADDLKRNAVRHIEDAKVFLEGNRQKHEKKLIQLLNEMQFDVSLDITNNDFIKTPQESQRNWIISRFNLEMQDDIIHLDKIVDRFKDSLPGDQQAIQSWEQPLMEKMADIAAESHGDVLEIGFGKGISATRMIERGVSSYTVVECNEEVITFFNEWRKQYPAVPVKLIKGKWQDVTGQLDMYDAVFFDTYPLNEKEFTEHVTNNITFAEYFFPTAFDHLKPGGVFTYYTNEIDTFSRRHQRLVLSYFDNFTLSLASPLSPPVDCNYWWADSMVVIKAVKSLSGNTDNHVKNARLTNASFKDFKLDIGIKNDAFINPPSGDKRNWIIQRFLEENREDLFYINKVVDRFVSGSQREFISDEWEKSKAVYSKEELIIDNQQVMQSWERPLMEKMADIATESHGDVLEIGFGMGISATYMIEKGVRSYTVIECNEEVITFFNEWRKQYPAIPIKLIKGKWQDVTDQLDMYDAIFFDTYPLDEEEFVEHVINKITFAEYFFPTAYDHLKPGGVFTYYTNEIDTFSRRHQRLVFSYFDSFGISVASPLSPPADCNYWWADSMVVIKAIKSGKEIRNAGTDTVSDLSRRIAKLPDGDKIILASQLGFKYSSESDNGQLVAYITAKTELSTDELRSYLKETLPGYMIPSYYVQLKELPLNANGKIDKKALPDPEGLDLSRGDEYMASRNEMEEKLVSLWQKVLQRENIGIKNDFFALGGHSLKAVRLSNEYQKEFSVKLSLKDLFAHTTIISHAELIGSSKRSEFIQIEKVAPQESYAISDAQRRLWILSQLEGGSVAYNIPTFARLNEDIDVECFKRAIDATIDRHEILRTVFKENGSGEVRQWILKKEELGFKIDHVDFRSEQDKEEKIKNYIAEDSYKPFDLVNGPLLRAGLLRAGDQEYVFYYNMHHIINDGWSIEVLSKDVFAYYKAYKDNKKPELKELRIQYKDYSAWELRQLKDESTKVHREYWLDSLKGELQPLDLPSKKQRPKVRTNNGNGLGTYLDKTTTGKLKRYSEENGGSLFMGLLAAWNVLMYCYTSQTDIIIGTSIAARDHADLEDQIGFYSNTLALRNEIKPGESFDSFYRTVRDGTLKSYTHQMYPFIRLAEELNVQRDTSRNAIFDIMLFLQNNGENAQGLDPLVIGLKEEEINAIADLGYRTSKFDISLAIHEAGDHLLFQVVYNPDVYDKEMVAGLLRHYRQLLNVLMESPAKKICEVDYLSPEEKHRLLHVFNDASPDYPVEKTVVELFEEQAIRTPDNLAVAFKDKKLTYKVLDELANKLAHHLKANYEINPDDRIGIQLNRSEWMIVSILGILKAGAAYVPIDPEDPSSRKEYILKDAALKVLITEVNFIHDLDYYEGNVLAVDVEFDPESYNSEKPSRVTTPDNLAYVIYTSGSTGMPKGAMISSRSIVDYAFGVLRKTNLNECKSFGLVSTIAADLGNTVIYTSLLTGASLRIFDKKDIFHADRLMGNNLDCLKMTPSHWKALQTDQSFFVPNKCLILGGEQFPEEIVKRVKLNDGACEVYNHYGPTETTIGKLIKHIGKDQNAFELSLGKPIGNNQVYILNAGLRLCPVGVTGEICISGDGLARGYLNQEELTLEKFVTHPFKAGERLYRTGDLGRWLPDGSIAFLGRKDDQVKIRGFRIEPGEIEQAILKHQQIEDTVVIAWENPNGEKELVAYIVSEAEQNISDLKSHLKAVLPEYMLPAHYVQLEVIPMTSNGKIDKRSLPDPQGTSVSGSAEYMAPRNEIEAKIIETIADILERPKERIGVNDNFFDLGLSSLGLIKLYTLINKDLKLNLKAVSVFEFSTVAALTAYIYNEPAEGIAVLKEDNISGAMDEMIDLM